MYSSGRIQLPIQSLKRQKFIVFSYIKRVRDTVRMKSGTVYEVIECHCRAVYYYTTFFDIDMRNYCLTHNIYACLTYLRMKRLDHCFWIPNACGAHKERFACC